MGLAGRPLALIGPTKGKTGRRGSTAAVAAELDRIIHERLRLAIVIALAAQPVLTFTELKTLLQTTDGNLSVHARKLEDAAYIRCRKIFDGRVPKTEYSLTPSGRRALNRYASQMRTLLAAPPR
jgi:DNA-binding HxlR family transcriptional regulator